MTKKMLFAVIVGFLFLLPSGVFGDYLSPFDKALIQTANNISKSPNIPKNTKMVVMGFKESSSRKPLKLSAVIEDDLSNTLINKMPGRIIAKNHIETVLKELKITRDDVFDSKNRKQFGKLLSADLIITGSYWLGDGMVNINIEVVDIENGLAIFSDRVKVKQNLFSKDLFN
ncbi:MAG: CsgG/HfaB family protein [Endomicrobium sp.]|jgi:TolB-like protein|nr:CsgG/HfaB family protein [Endomicrobium sp.]